MPPLGQGLGHGSQYRGELSATEPVELLATGLGRGVLAGAGLVQAKRCAQPKNSRSQIGQLFLGVAAGRAGTLVQAVAELIADYVECNRVSR